MGVELTPDVHGVSKERRSVFYIGQTVDQEFSHTAPQMLVGGIVRIKSRVGSVDALGVGIENCGVTGRCPGELRVSQGRREGRNQGGGGKGEGR